MIEGQIDINFRGNPLRKINFKISNNPWVNNGIMVLAHEIKKTFPEKVKIVYSSDKVEILSSEDIYGKIAEVLHNFAAIGTYNFSTSLKIINKKLKKNYSPQIAYPLNMQDTREILLIQEEDKKILKEKKNNSDIKQKIWKTRLSYLIINTAESYINYGLNFEKQAEYNKLIKMKFGKSICPFCGEKTNSKIDIKESLNPFCGEHHNNVIDGISEQQSGREKIKSCPKCFAASLFSLFNYYLPFFQDNKKRTILSIPRTSNIELLKKVMNNLTLHGQYIDFSDPNTESYSTNIKKIVHNSSYGCLLTLLHNILNKYYEEQVSEIEWSLEPIDKNEFPEITEWLFLGKKAQVPREETKAKHIKANDKIYNLFEVQKDPRNNADVYLVPDALNNLPFGNTPEYEIEQFFRGILELNTNKISKALFLFAKNSVSNPPIYINSILIYRNLFINKITMEVIVLDEDTKKSVRSIAESIGKGFHEKIGILQKFAYSTNQSEFKNSLEDSTFQLAKISVLEGKTEWVDKDSLEKLFEILNETNEFDEIRNYFVSFMSTQVIIENYKKSKKGEKS